MPPTSTSKSRRDSAVTARRNGGTRSTPRAKANSASKTLSIRSNGYTKSEKNIPDRAAFNRVLQRAVDQKNEGDCSGAIRTLSEAVAVCPESVRAHYLLGAVWLYGLKKPKKAEPIFREATRLAPQWERVSLGLFHSLWDQGREKAALRELKRFQAIAHCKDYDEIITELKQKGLWS